MAYIQLSGVDAYFSELKARDVALSELGNRPYGMRDFEVVDPRMGTDLSSESRPSASIVIKCQATKVSAPPLS